MKSQSYMYTILAGAAVLLGSCSPEPYPVPFNAMPSDGPFFSPKKQVRDRMASDKEKP